MSVRIRGPNSRRVSEATYFSCLLVSLNIRNRYRLSAASCRVHHCRSKSIQFYRRYPAKTKHRRGIRYKAVVFRDKAFANLDVLLPVAADAPKAFRREFRDRMRAPCSYHCFVDCLLLHEGPRAAHNVAGESPFLPHGSVTQLKDSIASRRDTRRSLCNRLADVS